jgi:ribonuclease HII
MVMVALAFKQSQIKKLEWMGVKDSKLLSPIAREELFDRIREVVHDFRVEVIEPDAIDLSLNSDDCNLNWLEAKTSARMVSELNPNKIIIDCPSINLKAYKQYFSNKLSQGVKDQAELLVEHKADLNHIVVAAASVVAKVIRDRTIEHTKQEIGIDFGSGYLTDPKTQHFLQNHYDKFPHLFRQTWSTIKKLQEAKMQKKLADF